MNQNFLWKNDSIGKRRKGGLFFIVADSITLTSVENVASMDISGNGLNRMHITLQFRIMYSQN